jgi:hypothetical protein
VVLVSLTCLPVFATFTDGLNASLTTATHSSG